jgi:hypothetical protein
MAFGKMINLPFQQRNFLRREGQLLLKMPIEMELTLGRLGS